MGAHGWEWTYLWPPFHGNHGGSEAAVMSRGTTFHSHPQVCTSPSHPLNPQKTSINKSGSHKGHGTGHWLYYTVTNQPLLQPPTQTGHSRCYTAAAIEDRHGRGRGMDMDMCLDMGRKIAGMCVIMDRDRGTHISSARRHLCQLGAFLGVGAIVASFVPAECPAGGGGGGMWGIFRKPLKRAIWNTPGLHAVLTTCLRFLSFLDGACVACCLFLSTGSHHVRIQIHVHCRNLWFAKERALAGRTGCMLLIGRRLAKQKGLVQPVRSNLHATRWNTRFYPLLRPLRLQCSFGMKRLTRPRLHSLRLLQP